MPKDITVRLPEWAEGVEDDCVREFLVYCYFAVALAERAGAHRFKKSSAEFDRGERILDGDVAPNVNSAQPDWSRAYNDIARAQRYIVRSEAYAHQARKRSK